MPGSKNIRGLKTAKVAFLLYSLSLLLSNISYSCTDRKVAMIGDKEITKKELDEALQRIPERKRVKFQKRILEDLIQVRVFSNEAKKIGMENNPDLKAELEKIKNEVLARFFIKYYVDEQAKPTLGEIKDYYNKHKDEFIVPEGVLIKHLLFKRQDVAKGVLKNIINGDSFEKLAKKRSICRCYKKGGYHGWVYRGRNDSELEKIIFNLETGMMSDIIKTKDGYEIVKILDKSVPRVMKFEETKRKIHNRFFHGRKNKVIEDYYKRAKVNHTPAKKGVLAVIGNEEINEEIIIDILAKCSKKEREKVRNRWAKYITKIKVFSNEARRINLENDPKIKKELQSRIDRSLAKAFKKQYITDKVKIYDKEIQKYYKSHLEEYRVPVKLRLKAILVKTREEAQNIMQELKGGTAFGHLAIKKSIYPMASRRAGEIGWISKGVGDPTIENAAFTLKLGEISDIIKTEKGYKILKLMDKKGGEVQPYEQVKTSIKMRLMREKIQDIKDKYYNNSQVKIFYM